MRVFLSNFTGYYYTDVARKLIEEGMEVSHLITLKFEETIEPIKDLKITFINADNFVYPDQIINLNKNNPMILTSEILHEYKDTELLFLMNSDRFAFYPISVRKRKLFYREILLYWLNFFEHNKIDAVLFPNVPHFNYDNIIYHIAKKKGIKTLYSIFTVIPNRILIKEDINDKTKVPSTFLKNKKKKDIINYIGKDLYNEFIGKSEVWEFSFNKLNVILNKKSNYLLYVLKVFLKKLNKMKQNSFLSIIKKISKIVFRNPFKHQLSSALMYNGKFSAIYISFLNLINFFRLRKLYKSYSRLTKKIDFNKKFVFFAMSVQPENTTTIPVDIYTDQVLAIKILSNTIPEDWNIYVKEHPSSFPSSIFLNLKHYRQALDYKRISEIPKAKLVDINIPAERLIKNSQFTAVLTNNSGWESLINNKPVMAFGYPWYCSCRSCFVTIKEKEVKDAFKKIIKKTATDVELDVLKFYAFHKDNFIVAPSNMIYADKNKEQYDIEVKNLATAFKNRIEGI